MFPSARIITGITLASAALALGCTQAQPAAAKVMPYDGGSVAVTTFINPNTCPLQRIGHQLIRCDALTGNEVPAPDWIPVFQPQTPSVISGGASMRFRTSAAQTQQR